MIATGIRTSWRDLRVAPRWIAESRHQSRRDVAMTLHQPVPSARGWVLLQTAHP